MKIKPAFNVLKQTASEFNSDNVLRLSAALAYYAIFSIGPLLAIVVGVAGLAFGNDTIRQQIQQALHGMLGEGAAKTVDSMIAARSHGTSLVTTILGVAALLIGAGGVFAQLQDSLNTIWKVKSKPGGGIWALLRDRFLSFSMVLGVGFLLLVSLAISTALAAFTRYLNHAIPMGAALGHVVDFAVSFGVVTLLFAMIFKYLPDVKVPWSRVWVGAIGTALLFTLGKFLLTLYLGRESTTSAYGAAGSVIVILMWVYYASVILFFGAEFTHVYSKATGVNPVPTKYAVPVTSEERAAQGMSTRESPRVERPARPAHAHGTGLQSSECARPESPQPRIVPGRIAHDRATEFVWLMFGTGLLAGTLLQFRTLRKVLKWYRRL